MFKLVIGEPSGKSWKLELESEYLVGKQIGDVIDGKELKAELAGYQLQLMGGSDSAGFPLSSTLEGIGLGKVLLSEGWGMRDTHEGIRRRKTVRGKQISALVTQLNLNVVKAGTKKLAEIFPEQNQPKVKAPKAVAPTA